LSAPDKIDVLIVDDRPENLLALESLLESPELSIIRASSGNEALGKMLDYSFGLVILDVQMPDMDGFEVASLMRSSRHTKDVPIIFVTAISKDESHVFKGYSSGAVDYLFKPIDTDILKRKVAVFIELHRKQMALQKSKTRLEEAMRELEAATAAREEKARLEGVMEMAGAACHELSQPLQAVFWEFELLVMKLEDNPEIKASLETINGELQRLGGLVSKIQNITRYSVQEYTHNTRIIDIHKASSQD
jgi:two-component system cell cycle response regulator